MTEERITETRMPGGETRTTHTVVTNEPRRTGSGWVIALVLLAALVAGTYFFSQMSDAEVAKDNAITDAANDVGEAADAVGNAVTPGS